MRWRSFGNGYISQSTNLGGVSMQLAGYAGTFEVAFDSSDRAGAAHTYQTGAERSGRRYGQPRVTARREKFGFIGNRRENNGITLTGV